MKFKVFKTCHDDIRGCYKLSVLGSYTADVEVGATVAKAREFKGSGGLVLDAITIAAPTRRGTDQLDECPTHSQVFLKS